MIQINLIGAGRVGQTWITLIQPLHNYSLQAICHGRENKAKIAEFPAADLFFITVPDDHIAETAKIVCQHHRNTTLIHCSGSLPASILNRENRVDIQVASIHPLISIANPKKTAANFAGTICTLEGDSAALETISALFNALGAELHVIDAHQKPAYHAASCLAANYLVTLADMACQQFVTAKIDKITAKRMTEQLMQSVMDNSTDKDNHNTILTGPIARGDQQTIKNHLTALKPGLKEIYCALGKQTVEIADLSHEKKALILSLFNHTESSIN